MQSFGREAPHLAFAGVGGAAGAGVQGSGEVGGLGAVGSGVWGVGRQFSKLRKGKRGGG